MAAQLSMFQPAHGRPRSVELAGRNEGERLAREGRARAYSNAGGDFRQGIARVVEIIASRQRFLTMDDVREEAAKRGIEPAHYNAWRSVLRSAAQRGHVRCREDLPRVPSSRPEAHGNPNLQWESLIHRERGERP